MKSKEIIYSLTKEDIQNVSLSELGRNLSSVEIRKVIPFIEEKINWYEVISDSINECIKSQNLKKVRNK